MFSAPPRSRTSSCSFEDCRAVRHTRKANGCLSGVEPLPSGSQPGVQNPLHHRRHKLSHYVDQDSNPERFVRSKA